MKKKFSVKQIICLGGASRNKNCGLGMDFQYRAIDFNLGIGTTSPGEKLEVNGNIKLTGRIRQGNMGDMAEMMALSPMVLDYARGVSHDVRSNNMSRAESRDILRAVMRAYQESRVEKFSASTPLPSQTIRRYADICN